MDDGWDDDAVDGGWCFTDRAADHCHRKAAAKMSAREPTDYRR